MIVVSNASPLISLGAIGQLGLLHGLFGEISIPLAVLPLEAPDLSKPWN